MVIRKLQSAMSGWIVTVKVLVPFPLLARHTSYTAKSHADPELDEDEHERQPLDRKLYKRIRRKPTPPPKETWLQYTLQQS